MQLQKRLKSLLKKAGLNENEADFYLFVLENKGCSIADVYKNSKLSKTTAYRAYESLKNLQILDSESDSWKTNLQALSLEGLIRKIGNEQRRKRRLVNELKFLDKAKALSCNYKTPDIQVINDLEKIKEKYLELSETEFNMDLAFGSWEDFSYGPNSVEIEKKFIQNRLKNGGGARIFLTKDGPNTHEITDYDVEENRKSMMVETTYTKPTWINAFEGNNFVYIWEMDENQTPYATLIDSKPIANFYKSFIYTHAV